MMYGGYGAMGMLVGGLFGLAALAGLIVLIIFVARKGSGTYLVPPAATPTAAAHAAHPNPAPATPRQILDERYARGELTTEEYQERLKNLGLS